MRRAAAIRDRVAVERVAVERVAVERTDAIEGR
ncbi:MAG: hypothetical protein AMXMBFR46_28550, partial [Acidimicrobiia bacterium]